MTLVAALALALCPASRFAGQAGPDEVQRRSQRAREALAQHDLQRAVQEYAEILKIDPRNAEVHAAQGMALYGLGKPAEAASVLQTALALDSGQLMAELFLGLSRADLGQCADVLERPVCFSLCDECLGLVLADRLHVREADANGKPGDLTA